jgi:cytochrome bd-type quinol oxidase subunit 2
VAIEVEEAPARARLRWWREVVYVLGFYVVYSAVRNAGTGADSVTQAFHHAQSVIRIERLVGLYHEETIQELFLPHHWFIRGWNIYYGSFHFVVTAAALVWCFRKRPDRYPLWRNTLAATTALALLGFAFFPLMPPRLLPASSGFVDTLAHYGGLWSFDSGTMKAVSNQYAAMPSLHFGWSTWSMHVLWPATVG